MTVKEVIKCMWVNDRVEIKQDGFNVWSGYVKNTSILENYHNILDKQCLNVWKKFIIIDLRKMILCTQKIINRDLTKLNQDLVKV